MGQKCPKFDHMVYEWLQSMHLQITYLLIGIQTSDSDRLTVETIKLKGLSKVAVPIIIY